jgi:hypothetical protein
LQTCETKQHRNDPLPHEVHAATRFMVSRSHLFRGAPHKSVFFARDRVTILDLTSKATHKRRARLRENMFILRCAKLLNQRELLNRKWSDSTYILATRFTPTTTTTTNTTTSPISPPSLRRARSPFRRAQSHSQPHAPLSAPVRARLHQQRELARVRSARYDQHRAVELPPELYNLLRFCHFLDSHLPKTRDHDRTSAVSAGVDGSVAQSLAGASDYASFVRILTADLQPQAAEIRDDLSPSLVDARWSDVQLLALVHDEILW